MPYLNPPQNGVKPPSRFSSLNVFKLKSGVCPSYFFSSCEQLMRSFRPADAAPPPPPKDSAYASSPNPSLSPPTPAFYNRSLFSLPESISGPATPSTPYLPIPSAGLEFGKRSNTALVTLSARTAASSPAPSASGGSLKSLGRGGGDYLPSPSMDGSTDSSGSCPNVNFNANANFDMYLLNGANSSTYTMGQATTASVKSKKNVFNLVSLAKRNKSKKDLSDTASAFSRSASVNDQEGASGKVEGDDGISSPWNFQHNIHVDEGYIGLPPSWTSTLSQVGFNDDEIAAIHARRRAAVTGTVPNTPPSNLPIEWPPSPHTLTLAPPTSSASSSTIILDPAPRSTSLGKGRDVLTINPSSMYSVATSIGGSTLGRASPTPSPRAPSFSMKSFVSSFKSSLTSDSASMKEGVDGSSVGEGASGEESEQFVFVDGDSPDEGGDRGMGDETEHYHFDTSSVSSHQTHSSRIRQISQVIIFGPHPVVTFTLFSRGNRRHERPTFRRFKCNVPNPIPSTSHFIPQPPVHPPRSPTPTPSPYLHPQVDTLTLIILPLHHPPTPYQCRRIYHVANPSSDSYNGMNFTEPPPAYVSPKKDGWIPRKEKEGFGFLGVPTSTQQACSPDSYSRHEVLDISSYYSNNSVNGGVDAEMDPAQQAKMLSPTPPLVIDKRMLKLATLPPRISFHQEGSLEDWSESLFSVIGSKGKRSSILVDKASMKKDRRSAIRPMSPPSMIGGDASATASSSLSPETETETVTSSLSDMSFGANLTLGPHARGTMGAVEEGDEQHQAEEGIHEDDAGEQAVDAGTTTVAEEEVREVDRSPAAPSTPLLPDVSLGPNVSSLVKDLDPPASTPPESPEPPRRVSVDSLPPSPPPKPKPKPAPLIMLPTATLALPRMSVITGISGKSPVNSLFGAKPQPLPIPIPPSQIRAQLRPAPPKSLHPPPTLPLPPLKRLTSQLNLPLPPLIQPQLSPLPSPQKAFKHDSTISHASPSDSRPSSSQTLLPDRINSDRDSGLSTITVTPATIATAKTELVRTAVASVVDSDTVSLASKRESVVPTTDTDRQTLAYDEPDMGAESPRTQEREEVPDDSLTSESSSVSLLRDGPQSKWPTPPPPPVELEADTTPRRNGWLGDIAHQLSLFPWELIQLHERELVVADAKGAQWRVPFYSAKDEGWVGRRGKISELDDGYLWRHTHAGISHIDIYAPASGAAAALHLTSHSVVLFHEPGRDRRRREWFVFAARVASSFADGRSHEGQQDNTERPLPLGTSHVAVKRIPLPPVAFSPSLTDDSPVSNKVVSVLHELTVLKDLDHEHLLLLDAIYVGSNSADDEPASMPDTSLWIRMELMERSLADVIGLVAEGLALQERLIARFASDILHGLDCLQRQHIAHRDVRSDNLLVNAAGVVKLADFSNAIRVDRNAPNVSGAVGVIYWQAPEMRAGPYNALKVDIWSLGATVWELAETVPPFSSPASPSTQVSFAIQATRHIGSQWPPLTHPEHYSRQFHEFMKLCGRESAGRPSPGELLNTSFIRNACGRPVILQLLSQCRAIEETIAATEASSGPIMIDDRASAFFGTSYFPFFF
ncbi:hypothetical protein JVT61DRAFT_14490 [Boletus reticuloceps]|uniref:Non-specific serine/threonine protein kinase n=1 Tax=Boletus reticuloceps TaxID=495285 RepID=A0A8I2YRF7_9AGAM|nr:hypothetical protein JVT61DRAFT_14490 [Boletus reticuloceps]